MLVIHSVSVKYLIDKHLQKIIRFNVPTTFLYNNIQHHRLSPLPCPLDEYPYLLYSSTTARGNEIIKINATVYVWKREKYQLAKAAMLLARRMENSQQLLL